MTQMSGVGALIKALKEGDTETRIRAASVLGETRDPQAVKPLIHALEDQNSRVRYTAAWALGEIKDPQAVEPLNKALKDLNRKVQDAAILALKEIKRSQAIEPQNKVQEEKKGSSDDALVNKRKITIETLIHDLGNKNSMVRADAAWTLGRKGSATAVKPLIGALKDEDSTVRKRAAYALGIIGDSRAEEPLKEAMRDLDDGVRDLATWALRGMNPTLAEIERAQAEIERIRSFEISDDYNLLVDFIKNNLLHKVEENDKYRLLELLQYKNHNIDEVLFKELYDKELYKQLLITIDNDVSFGAPSNTEQLIMNYNMIKYKYLNIYNKEYILTILANIIKNKHNENYGVNNLWSKIAEIERREEMRRFEDKIRHGSLIKVTIEDVDKMNGLEFEDFLFKLFSRMGYNVINIKHSGDQGADLILNRIGWKIVVQAKNYQGAVSNTAVQEVVAAKGYYKADEGWVVTNNYLTPSAEQLAQANNIKIIDRDSLQEKIQEYY